jgi:hypothetical protein
MVHPVLIVAHAACAIAAFVLGLVAALHPAAQPSGTFRAYLATLSLAVVFLVLVVALDWSGLDAVKRGTFAALLVLAGYTAWRGWHATRTVGTPAFIDDVGFTLISLFAGFVIVSAFDLGLPLWLLPAIGVVGILLGIAGVHRMKLAGATS